MIKADIFTTTEGLEMICSMLSDIGHSSVVIKDAADFENFLEGKYGDWDYIDCELMKLRDVETTITLYLPDDVEGQEKLSEIHEMLVRIKASDSADKLGRLECSTEKVPDENWENEWKRYFEPIQIGERIIVCPPWENPEPNGRKIIRIDPGMAFGTGIDETTRLCLEVLESVVESGKTVFDVGCGSGILSIGALLLGAESALGIDISQDAINSANKNAELNGVENRIEFIHGSPFDHIMNKHDIVCANISADVIITLAQNFLDYLKPGGVLILSGIIEERDQEVINTMLSLGFTFKSRKVENGWTCITTTL